MDALSKREALWEKIAVEAKLPPYADTSKLIDFGKTLDYSELLNYADDVQPPGRTKVICSAGGACAKVKFVWKEVARSSFSGMFAGADVGMIRCSSVNEPSIPSRFSPFPGMVPMVALKMFRNGEAPSSNVVLAYRKSGQKDMNFLKHCVSNHFTENVKYPFGAALAVFKKYSDFPTFSGLAEFASMDQDGNKTEAPRAPYVLVLEPSKVSRQRKTAATKNIADQLRDFKAGDTLYDVYVVPEPLTHKAGSGKGYVCTAGELEACPNAPPIWRIGRLQLESSFTSSAFADEHLFFRHHLFEGDLALRPDWRGKVSTLLGAEFYEEVIERGHVWDPDVPDSSSKGSADKDAILCMALELAMNIDAADQNEVIKDMSKYDGFGRDVLTCPYQEDEVKEGREEGFARRAELRRQIAEVTGWEWKVEGNEGEKQWVLQRGDNMPAVLGAGACPFAGYLM